MPTNPRGEARFQEGSLHVRKDALWEAERDPWTQETGEDKREAGSETKPGENARKAQPQTRKHRLQQPPEPRRGGVRSQALPGISPFSCLVTNECTPRLLAGPAARVGLCRSGASQ